jgi:hypothetical protein
MRGLIDNAAVQGHRCCCGEAIEQLSKTQTALIRDCVPQTARHDSFEADKLSALIGK